MSLPIAAQQALEAFAACPGWEQRARLLMQWGERLEPLAENERTETNRVEGCDSQVWLVAEQHGNAWHFRASSEARLIRGLLAVLLARIDNLDARELATLDLPAWFDQLGLARQLSPSRASGLNAVLKRMTELASL